MKKSTTLYHIIDLDHSMEHPDTFDNFDRAKEALDEYYTNRDKKDGHDEYWQNRNTGIVKVIIEREVLFSNKNKI